MRIVGTGVPGTRIGTTLLPNSRSQQRKRQAQRSQRNFETGLSFFRSGGARPQTEVIVDFLRTHRHLYSIERMCCVLNEHEYTILPATFYRFQSRGFGPTAAELARGFEARKKAKISHRKQHGFSTLERSKADSVRPWGAGDRSTQCLRTPVEQEPSPNVLVRLIPLNQVRWFLWLKDVEPGDIQKSPLLRDRIEKVKELCSQSKRSGTKKRHSLRDFLAKIDSLIRRILGYSRLS